MKPYEFLFEVTHDSGTKRIKVAASSPGEAARIIQQAELCPERALKPVYKWIDFAYPTSTKALAVFGDTKPYKDKLKKLNARFNPYLKYNGNKQPGWIVSKQRKDQLDKILG